jgi:NTE family protein
MDDRANPTNESAAPVRWIAGDQPEQKPPSGTALCLSGGGYRAMLFHLGALWRLNEAGWLPRLDRVSSVSGGSIIAGMLALAWPRLAFDERGVSRAFEQEMVVPLRRIAGTTIDVPAVLHNFISPGAARDHIAAAYRKYLFGDCTLQDLPADGAGPRFVINGANLQSGALWRFSRPFMADYRVGRIDHPTLDLATAVAVSSAAPPFLSPVTLKLQPRDYLPNSGLDLQKPPYTTRPVLTDGGVYDNLGLETAWKNCATVLVSDGGGRTGATPSARGNWFLQTFRVLGVIDNQVRSLRKRQLLDSFTAPPNSPNYRRGAYWGTYSDIANYGRQATLPCPVERTMLLAKLPTRLAAFSSLNQERLINWGYAICETAMHVWVDDAVACPTQFPYPKVGV